VKQLRLVKRKGGTGTRLWVEDLAGSWGWSKSAWSEFPLGATVEDIEHPDTLVFDLDPGEGLEWGFVVGTTFRLRELLAAEGLDCWPKTTGGKGLHVMAPIEPEIAPMPTHAESPSACLPPHPIATSPRRRWRPGRGSCSPITCAMAISSRVRTCEIGFPIASPIRALNAPILPVPGTYSN
jgi:bifunctional non-homologous end joining protein LigD